MTAAAKQDRAALLAQVVADHRTALNRIIELAAPTGDRIADRILATLRVKAERRLNALKQAEYDLRVSPRVAFDPIAWRDNLPQTRDWLRDATFHAARAVKMGRAA